MTELRKSPFDDASGQELLKFLKENEIAIVGVSSVEGAGTTFDDATQAAAASTIDIAGGATNSGVRLPSSALGALIFVTNSGSNTVKLYPSTALSNFPGESAGNPIDIAAGANKLISRTSDLVYTVY